MPYVTTAEGEKKGKLCNNDWATNTNAKDMISNDGTGTGSTYPNFY